VPAKILKIEVLQDEMLEKIRNISQKNKLFLLFLQAN